jgi:hypothetical protein
VIGSVKSSVARFHILPPYIASENTMNEKKKKKGKKGKKKR